MPKTKPLLLAAKLKPLNAMYKSLLFLAAFTLSVLQGLAQSPQEMVAKMIKARLGENCIIRDGSGKQISYEDAAGKTIEASIAGLGIKYEPINVTEGVFQEARFRAGERSSIKPLIDEINFADPNIGFYNQDKKKISAAEFKATVQGSTEFMASAYNAKNGVITDYMIVPKPKPMALQASGDGGMATLKDLPQSALSVGSELPKFKMVDINGREWDAKNLRDKIVVLNFWFVECKPCIAEMPALNKLVAKYSNDDRVVFLSVANSDKEKIQKFLSDREFKYNHIAQEQAEKYLNDWKVSLYPQNVVVNRGKVAFSLAGSIKFTGGPQSEDDHMFKVLSKEIDKCLK